MPRQAGNRVGDTCYPLVLWVFGALSAISQEPPLSMGFPSESSVFTPRQARGEGVVPCGTSLEGSCATGVGWEADKKVCPFWWIQLSRCEPLTLDSQPQLGYPALDVFHPSQPGRLPQYELAARATGCQTRLVGDPRTAKARCALGLVPPGGTEPRAVGGLGAGQWARGSRAREATRSPAALRPRANPRA